MGWSQRADAGRGAGVCLEMRQSRAHRQLKMLPLGCDHVIPSWQKAEGPGYHRTPTAPSLNEYPLPGRGHRKTRGPLVSCDLKKQDGGGRVRDAGYQGMACSGEGDISPASIFSKIVDGETKIHHDLKPASPDGSLFSLSPLLSRPSLRGASDSLAIHRNAPLGTNSFLPSSQYRQCCDNDASIRLLLPFP